MTNSSPVYKTLLFFIALAMVPFAHCQENEKSIDEIAQELSNPVSATASLNLQGNYNLWGGSTPGATDQGSSSLVFLPTIPVKLGKYNLTIRPSFPLAGTPYQDESGTWQKKQGFGDMAILGLIGTATKSGFLYGLGPSIIMPTASDPLLGKQQWQLGPAALAGILKKWGVVGILWQHWWGISDPANGRDKVNVGTTQIFYWFSLKKGWQVGGSPITTANYIAGVDTDFSVPLNLGVAKTFVIGKMPLKTTIQGQYFVTRPNNFGPSWGVFFQISPVINLPW